MAVSKTIKCFENEGPEDYTDMGCSTVVLPLPEIFQAMGNSGISWTFCIIFILILTAWVASTAMSRWRCNHFCGPCLAIWVWWGKFGVSSGPWEQSCPYRRQQVLLRRKGRYVHLLQGRCSVVLRCIMTGYCSLVTKRAEFSRAVLILSVWKLLSYFSVWVFHQASLWEAETIFLSLHLHSLVSQELGRWDSSLHSSSLLPSYIDLM